MNDLILISVLCTCIIDITGAADEIYNSLLRLFLGLKKTYELPKPFGCSLCSSFWAGLIYLIVTQQFTLEMMTLNIVIAIILPQITQLIYDILQFIIKKIYEGLN